MLVYHTMAVRVVMCCQGIFAIETKPSHPVCEHFFDEVQGWSASQFPASAFLPEKNLVWTHILLGIVHTCASILCQQTCYASLHLLPSVVKTIQKSAPLFPLWKSNNKFNKCICSTPESVFCIWVHHNRFSYTDTPLNEITAAVTTTTSLSSAL